MSFCPNCGKEWTGMQAFCGRCGKRLHSESGTPVAERASVAESTSATPRIPATSVAPTAQYPVRAMQNYKAVRPKKKSEPKTVAERVQADLSSPLLLFTAILLTIHAVWGWTDLTKVSLLGTIYAVAAWWCFAANEKDRSLHFLQKVFTVHKYIGIVLNVLFAVGAFAFGMVVSVRGSNITDYPFLSDGLHLSVDDYLNVNAFLHAYGDAPVFYGTFGAVLFFLCAALQGTLFRFLQKTTASLQDTLQTKKNCLCYTGVVFGLLLGITVLSLSVRLLFKNTFFGKVVYVGMGRIGIFVAVACILLTVLVQRLRRFAYTHPDPEAKDGAEGKR